MSTLGSAVSDGPYRYLLTRRWSDLLEPISGGMVCWIMLNPSTADANIDDPTIRRCIAFSKAWGFSGMQVVNLFALRATNPKELYTHPDPIGPQNRQWVAQAINDCQLTVAAWGTHGKFLNRGEAMQAIYGHRLHHLGLTINRQPMHPLYLPANLKPIPWSLAA